MDVVGGEPDKNTCEADRTLDWREVVVLIRELGIPFSELVVVGGAALTARGLRPATDIDLVVTERAYAELRGRGLREEVYRPTAGRPKRLVTDWFDVGTAWGKGDYRPTIEHLFDSAIPVDGILCVPLAEVRKWKEQAMRPKDLPDLRLIQDATRSLGGEHGHS